MNNRDRLKRDGYPEGAVWASAGFWFAPARGWVLLGHRAVQDTAVLGPRLLRVLAADLNGLADSLEEQQQQGGEAA